MNKKLNLIFILIFLLVLSITFIYCEETTTQTGTGAQTGTTQTGNNENAFPKPQGFDVKMSEDGNTATYTPKENNAVLEYKTPDGLSQKIEGVSDGKITLEKSGNGQSIKDISVKMGVINSQYNIQLNGMNTPVAGGSVITGGGNKFNVNMAAGVSVTGEPKASPGTKDLKTEVGYSVSGNDRDSIKITAENGDKYSIGTMKYKQGGELKNSGELIFNGKGEKYFSGDSLYLNGKLVFNTADSSNSNVRVFTNGLRQDNLNSPYISMRQTGLNTNEAIVSGGSKESAGPAVLVSYPNGGSNSGDSEYFIIQGGKGSALSYMKSSTQIASLEVTGEHVFNLKDGALQITSDGKNMLKSFDSSSVYQQNSNFKDFIISVRGDNDKLLYQYGVVKDADKIPIAGEFKAGEMIGNPFGKGVASTSTIMNNLKQIEKNLDFISNYAEASTRENNQVTQDSIKARYGQLMQADTLFQIPQSSGTKTNPTSNPFYSLVDSVMGNNGNSQQQLNLGALRSNLYTQSGLVNAPFDVRGKAPVYMQLPFYDLLPNDLQAKIAPGSTFSQDQIQQGFYKFFRDNSNGNPTYFTQAYPQFIKQYPNLIPGEVRIALGIK